MRYWLMKSEPGDVSIDNLATLPNQTVAWYGVRNYQARNFMRDQMQVGAAAPQVVDLMAALEASVKAAKAARGRHPAAGPDLEVVGATKAPAKPRRVRKSA